MYCWFDFGQLEVYAFQFERLKTLAPFDRIRAS